MRNHPPFIDAIRIAVVEHGLAAKEIAALAGLHEKTIARHIEKSGLKPKPVLAPAAVRRRMARFAQDVLPRMEAEARRLADKKGDWNKTRLDAVTQLSRLMDRFGELASLDEEQQESAKDRDDRTAAALRRIDDRIVELATELAKRMVEEKSGQGQPALDRS
ncbi:MAG: hypothetical protein AB3N20_09040 [Rhizobiaceae bacterium]